MRKILSLVCLLSIAACSNLEVQSTIANDAAARTHARHYAEHIQLSGRILARYYQDQQEKSISGSYEWQQTPQSISITLLSPLGQTIANIKQDANGASLQQSDHNIRYAQDLDSLLNDSLGWALPVAGLRDWLQGFTRDTQGNIVAVAAQDGSEMQSNGWQIQFASWQAASPVLPKRIDLHRSTTQVGEVSLRIVIDQWETK